MAGSPLSLGRSLSLAARHALDAVDEKKPPQTVMMPRWARSPAAVSRRAFHSLSPFLFLLLPSFVADYLRPGTAAKSKPPHPTAYLDGLRGVAAFIVYIYHFALMWRYEDLEIGYWSPMSSHYWYQLPIVRLLVSGRASVTLFFVISGYVLSTRPLHLIHHHHQQQRRRGIPISTQQQQEQQHASDKVLSTLSSSVLRRPFRLYLPIAAATGLLSVLVQAGFPFRVNHISWAGVAFTADDPWGQLANWWATMTRLANPFSVEGLRGQGRHPVSWYIGPLWTIPIEFKGSLAVFLGLLALARLRRRGVAMAVTFLGGVVWQLRVGEVDMALFMAGLFLAEMYIVVPPSSSSSSPSVPSTNVALARVAPGRRLLLLCLHVAHHIVFLGLFIASLWLLSTPMIDTAGTPGYVILAGLAPWPFYAESPELEIANLVHLYWLAVGSILLVFTLMYAPPARMVATVPNMVSSSSSSSSSSTGTCCIPSPPTDEESQQQQNLGFFEHSSPLLVQPITTTTAQGPSLLGVQEQEQEQEQKDHPHEHDHHHHQQPLLHHLFTNRVAQYLGALSYSLYLLHEAVNHVVGSRYAGPGFDLWQTYEAFAAEDDPTAAQLARVLPAFRRRFWSWYVLGFVGNTVLLVWVSDLFMRAVDRPSVRFARWVGRVVEGRREA